MSEHLVSPSTGTLQPLGIDQVRITGGFWGERQQLNATTIIEHCEKWVEKMGWVGNFDAAIAGRLPGARTGRQFADSDVYKLIEAMAWEIGRTGDLAMDERLRALVDRIAPVQEADGYLNTNFGRRGQVGRYEDLPHGHELYCYGHLLQAAVARGRTTGDDLLVQIARRAADHLCEVFGDGGIESVCGHPEIEVGLVEFARYTNEPKYLQQAKLFIDRRGHGVLGDLELGRSYFQDDIPIRKSRAFAGHAVRATYLAAGAVDVAVETDDEELLHSVIDQLAHTVAARTYLTGGMGSRHEGEAFGGDFELPSDRAYAETCAGVGSIMLNYRLLLATGEPRYADLIERTLFNVIATAPGDDGQSFYYTNTLHQREPGEIAPTDEASMRAASSLRAPWYEVSCCPTNVARTLASLGSYFATATAEGIQLHQYAPGTVTTELDGGAVGISVATEYPNNGEVTIEVTDTIDEPWDIALRVPAWAKEGATVNVNGTIRNAGPGTVTLRETFAVGDTVQLSLPVEAHWVEPDPRIDSLRGQLAVERGPLVMCLESVDLQSGDVNAATVDRGSLTDDSGRVTVSIGSIGDVSDEWPYLDPAVMGAPTGPTTEMAPTTLTPYHAWANRGPSTMRVWMPTG
ncbi:glycoside hydrolase family 127 protein [Marisediminicola senii]|uniref:glycoside hydrolase family 127 protein n=1 Tax=Marisediminicola senii TaxID=2711233 RepID=UPI0013E9D5B2|nr:beta-L-arabinofuranosidase domain-containing protein [Marisediminicola senii]